MHVIIIASVFGTNHDASWIWKTNNILGFLNSYAAVMSYLLYEIFPVTLILKNVCIYIETNH